MFFFSTSEDSQAAVLVICITVLLLLKETCWIHYETKEATKYRQMWVYTRNVRVYLTFSLHWEKAMRGEEKKESGVIPFEFNTAGRLIDHALWLRCPGKSTLNQSDDEWANTWNTGLIVVKMTVIRMNGPKCINGCFFFSFFFSFLEIQNGCMPEWAVLSSTRGRRRKRNTFWVSGNWIIAPFTQALMET